MISIFYIVGILFAAHILYQLKRRVDSLAQELASLRGEIKQLKTPTAKGEASQPIPSTTQPHAIPAQQFETRREIAEKYPEPEIDEYPEPESDRHPARERAPSNPLKSFKDSEIWKRLETQFAGNVIGIVGTLAVVLGVIFLGVYAAIQLDAIGRFLVMCGFAFAFYALSIFLGRTSLWRDISLWIRSASGVTFLMACLGSIGFESMRWVQDPTLALGLLGLGLALNLALGFTNGAEVFASLHVVFSLFALAMVPLTPTTFSVAATVAFLGVAMSSKNRLWDRHVVASILAFTVLHVYWFVSFKTSGQSFPVEPLIAILVCAVVGIAGITSHYRKAYEKAVQQRVPLLAHVVAWSTMGLNLFLHSQGTKWATVFLALGASAAFAMSIRAKQMNIQWLFVCDRLVSLLLIIVATISLHRFGLTQFEIAVIAAMATTLFLRVVVQSFEVTLFKVANAVVLFAYGVVAVLTVVHLPFSEKVTLHQFMLIGSFALLAYVYPRIDKVAAELKAGIGVLLDGRSCTFIEIPISIHGVLALLLAVANREDAQLLVAPLVLLIGSLLLRFRVKNRILDLSVFISTSVAVVMFACLLLNSDSAGTLWVGSAALFLIGAVAFKFSWSEQWKQNVTWPGVGILWLAATIAAYVLLKDISPILPGMAWIMISLIACELRELKIVIPTSPADHNQTNIYISLCGVGSLVLFLFRYFLVDMSNEALAFGLVRIRIFSEVFWLGTMLYWIRYSKEIRDRLMQTVSDLFLECFMIVLSVFAAFELSGRAHPIVWSLFGFACFQMGRKNQRFNRLILYSYLFYFGSLFHIAFISTTLATPSNLLTDQAWVMGLLAIALNTSFMVFLHKQKGLLERTEMNLPRGLEGIVKFQKIVNRYELKVLLYPLFLAVGFFLFWSFEKSVLSLLWVIECFVLFLISIFMRESQFRIVSMAGIALIFLRIIFYDLTGRDFFVKAVVFISVGGILIAMNAIYNKYKHRYESKQ